MVMSTTTNIQSSSYKVLEIFFIILPAGRYIQDVKGGVPVVVQIGGGATKSVRVKDLVVLNLLVKATF